MRKIMERMDWGEVADFVTFGNIKASTIDDATYYILVTPQNVVGNTIMDPLIEMVTPLALALTLPTRKSKTPAHVGHGRICFCKVSSLPDRSILEMWAFTAPCTVQKR